mgnify:CR=1 FL=1|jgi:hypothetical protein
MRRAAFFYGSAPAGAVLEPRSRAVARSYGFNVR